MKNVRRITSTYSADVFGMCSALYELGGMTVMHDASGCNSTYTTHDEPRWYTMDSMVYISALAEMDAILGNDDKLIRDIVSTAREMHPRFIALGGTPIPNITGVDFPGIARVIERETGIPSMGFMTNGSKSYIVGAGNALRAVCERFAADHPDAPGGGKTPVNVLGLTPLDFSLTGNVARLRAWLDANGFSVISTLAMETDLSQVAQMGAAQVNLVVSETGLPAADYLRERFGTPYVVAIPMGTLAARATCQRLRGEVPPVCRAAASGRGTVIIGEPVFAASLREMLIRDLGHSDVTVVSPLGTLRPADFIRTISDETELAALLRGAECVIADPNYRALLAENTAVRFIDFPHEAFSGRLYHSLMKPFIADAAFAALRAERYENTQGGSSL